MGKQIEAQEGNVATNTPHDEQDHFELMEKSLANALNNCQIALKKSGVTGNYKDMRAKLSPTEKKCYAGTKSKTVVVGCSLDTFTKLIKEGKLDSSNYRTLDDSPFKCLFKLVDYKLNKKLIQDIASKFNVKEKSLMVGDTKHTLDVKDFTYILKIIDGNDDNKIDDNDKKPSDELVRQFCYEKNRKAVCNEGLLAILKDKKNKVDVLRAFAVAAMRYVVCAPAGGKLGVNYLRYVEDVDEIKTKPWATIAMEHLVKGVETYQNGKGKVSYLGGSMVFLQLYYLNKLTNMEPEKLLSLKDKDVNALLKGDKVKSPSVVVTKKALNHKKESIRGSGQLQSVIKTVKNQVVEQIESENENHTEDEGALVEQPSHVCGPCNEDLGNYGPTPTYKIIDEEKVDHLAKAVEGFKSKNEALTLENQELARKLKIALGKVELYEHIIKSTQAAIVPKLEKAIETLVTHASHFGGGDAVAGSGGVAAKAFIS